MTSLALLRGLLFAGECLAGSGVILALAFFAAGRVRDRAALRHLIWVAAFAVLLVLPVMALMMPARAVMTLPGAAAATQAVAARTAAIPAENLVIQDAAAAPVIDPSAPAAPQPVIPETPAPRLHVGLREVVLGGFAVWISGLFWIGFNATTSVFGLHLMRRDSIAYAPECTTIMPLNRGWELRLATRAGGCGPVTWGMLKPVVLLPQSAVLWSRERLEAVLTHELAHVRRRDAMTQALSLLVCGLYWPNPLVWAAARSLRREAEIAADDAVLDAGIKPSTYAGELVQLAAEFRAARLDAAVAMASPSALEARIRSVLAPTPSRKGVTPMDALKIAALGSVCCVALALARPDLALAQPAPPPAPLAPIAPPAPPAPAAAPAPLAPLAPLGRHRMRVQVSHDEDALAEVDGDADIDLHGTINGKPFNLERHGHAMTPEERARLNAEMARLKAEMARIGPEIQRAVANAHIAEKAAHALEKAQPQIDAAIQKAMAQVGPAIDRAMAEADRAQVHVHRDRHEDNDDADDDAPPSPPSPSAPGQDN